MRNTARWTRSSWLAGLLVALILPTCAWAADMSTKAPAQTQEADPPWYVRVGLGSVLFDSDATIYTPAGIVPGASAHAGNNLTALFEVGYFINDNIAVSLTGGYPPTTTLTGVGTAKGLGALGDVTYGPATATLHYHFKNFGLIQPYVGAGVGYAIIFNASDGAVKDLHVSGAPAFVLQAGVDYVIDRNWVAFVDVKKLFLAVDATGFLGPVPVRADVSLDPLVLFTGIAYRF